MRGGDQREGRRKKNNLRKKMGSLRRCDLELDFGDAEKKLLKVYVTTDQNTQTPETQKTVVSLAHSITVHRKMWPSSGMLALRAYFPVQNRKPLLSYAYRCALTQIIQKSENKKLQIVFITYPPSDIIRHSLTVTIAPLFNRYHIQEQKGLTPFLIYS